MAQLHVFLLTCCPQLFDRILTNHFEQTVAWEAICRGLHLDQTGINQRRDGQESLIGSDGFVSPTDGLCCDQLASSHEDGKPAEPALWRGRKQVVAPSNRFLHGSLAFWQISGAPTQQAQPVRVTLEQ